MSAENDNSDSSSSGSEMEQDTPHKHKSGFKGQGDDILMPVRYLIILVLSTPSIKCSINIMYLCFFDNCNS